MEDLQGAQIIIQYGHHKVHHGDMFTISDVDTSVDIAAPKYWRVHTSAVKEVHVEVKVSASNAAVAYIYETPTVSTAGSALALVNRNRRSLKLLGATAFYDTTVSADGTLLEVQRVGTGQGQQGMNTGERGEEFVFDLNKDYIFKVVVGANGTSVEIHINLYEV